MDSLHIIGGARLAGQVAASGAKNSALPIMAASILAEGEIRLRNVPCLTDVETMSLVLGHLGIDVKRQCDHSLQLVTVDPRSTTADDELVGRVRASFCVLGPLLARRGQARVSLPGGCNIGHRPVDIHLRGLEALGADIRIEHGYVCAKARRLRGTTIDLRGPAGPTVTGTANILCAAVTARGVTRITSAAREPEIVDLGNFLTSLGARISGLGTERIEIQGVESLGGGDYTIIPDRVEAATLLIAGAISRGRVSVNQIVPEHMTAVLDVLYEMGADVDVGRNEVRVSAPRPLYPRNIRATPYPGVPTDVQSQIMALLTLVTGRSRVRDDVFPERFHHVSELNRLGATITRRGATAHITGARRLSGAVCTAADLRASAALVLAGLAADGVTIVRRVDHLDRGYERLEEKLSRLGARIRRATAPSRATERDDGLAQISAAQR